MVWLLTLGALWLVLTRGDLSSWVIGLPFIVLAVWLMQPTAPKNRQSAGFNLLGLVRFIGFFLRESWLGGIDVGRRVLATRLDVQPGFYDYPLRLRGNGARQLFVGSVSLLPGTLSAQWRGDRVRIHSLDIERITRQDVERLELSIARINGEEL